MGSSARMCTVLPADHVFARRSRRRCTLKAMVGDDVAPTEIDDSLVIPEPRVITSPFTLRVFGIASGMLWLFSFLFSRLERWSLLDAFYFTASTMTCVGYGDLRAQCMVSRILCAIAQLFGAGFLAGLVGATLSEWYRENEKKTPLEEAPTGLTSAQLAADAGLVSPSSTTGRTSRQTPPSPLYCRLLSPRSPTAQCVALLAAGVCGFKATEPLHSWADALFCIIGTLTTAGIGDVVPRGNRAKFFIAVYSLVGTLAFARFIGQARPQPPAPALALTLTLTRSLAFTATRQPTLNLTFTLTLTLTLRRTLALTLTLTLTLSQFALRPLEAARRRAQRAVLEK